MSTKIYSVLLQLTIDFFPLDIMEFFIKNPERKISEDELKQRIWTEENNNENIVPMYITYLQEKFVALNADVKINYINGYSIDKIM